MEGVCWGQCWRPLVGLLRRAVGILWRLGEGTSLLPGLGISWRRVRGILLRLELGTWRIQAQVRAWWWRLRVGILLGEVLSDWPIRFRRGSLLAGQGTLLLVERGTSLLAGLETLLLVGRGTSGWISKCLTPCPVAEADLCLCRRGRYALTPELIGLFGAGGAWFGVFRGCGGGLFGCGGWVACGFCGGRRLGGGL